MLPLPPFGGSPLPPGIFAIDSGVCFIVRVESCAVGKPPDTLEVEPAGTCFTREAATPTPAPAIAMTMMTATRTGLLPVTRGGEGPGVYSGVVPYAPSGTPNPPGGG